MFLRKFITPHQKVMIRSVQYGIFRTLHGLSKVNTSLDYSTVKQQNNDIFFGYYDITPFNCNDEILYLKKRDSENTVLICLNDSNDLKQEVILSCSKAWNWQQGCRLRWFPGYDDRIVFNFFEDGHYGARIIDTKGNKLRDFNQPLYDISQDGSLGLSLNFERLGIMRPGYGYTCREYMPYDLHNESIDLIDLSADSIIKRLTYNEIAEITFHQHNFDNCYINHLSFSPSGKRFLFFWIEILDGYHKASLCVYDIDLGIIIPLEIKEKVSHYVWVDDDNIICTSYINPNTCRYYIYNISHKTKNVFCPQSLLEDGHPSVDSIQTILTDTYPDKNGFQHLYLVDSQKDIKQDICMVYMKPSETGEKRTDLHPRFNINHTKICIDTNRNGHRELMIIRR